MWQSLWCNDIPTAPRQVPQSQAPYWAFCLASTILGSLTICGSEVARAEVPSRAKREIMGFVLRA